MNKTELNIFLSNEPPRALASPNHSLIPVPKIGNPLRPAERCPPKRRESLERTARTTSVAAQRATFERSESPIRWKSKNTATSSISETKNSNERLSAVANKRQEMDQKFNRSNSFSENKWKSKFEESEKRRKALLQKGDSAAKEHVDLERKHQQLQRLYNALQGQMQEKEQKLNKLRTVSEAVCKEYEQLKHQYDVETGAMHKAMQQASQWYKQNRELKRRSQVLTQKFLQVNPDGILDIDLADEVDSNPDDIEQLRETVKELSQDIARLQTELNAARLQEFEAQEQAALLSAQLDEERALRCQGDEKLKEMTMKRENMERVTRMVAEEVQALKTQCDRERENAQMMKMEADRVQKERNVLAHQSALLLAEVNEDPDGRLLCVLQEVESLKRLLEEEQQSHRLQIQLMQEKLEEKESNVEFEIVEEKLKLAESELEMVQARAERAEKSAEEFERLAQELKEKVEEMEKKHTLPPPPPPPPPPLFLNSSPSIKLMTRGMTNGDRSTAVSDMENILGIVKKNPAVPQQPAIDDIINQIKGGRFTLKQTDREEERRRKQEAEAAPPAVSEMLNILGTMRRRAKPIRQSFKLNDSTA
ncbi:shootin-1 isoform X2 [Orussus abietinus]|uniref:shootin-1 isoform X2 n=1 Tax=Orussus abietinus TaxID=222816 RepID=UPI000625716C|nr:shootin-1 isoform X2 [Orussus abietinus]